MVGVVEVSPMRERNIWVLRHGEKSRYNGNLSRRGHKHAKKFGKSFAPNKPFYIYTSSAPRVRETLSTFLSGISPQRVRGIEEREDLSMSSFLKDRHHSEYFRRSRQCAEVAYRVPRIFGKKRKAVELMEAKNLERWLRWKEDPALLQDAPYTAYPPELARAMAPLLLHQIEGVLPGKNTYQQDEEFHVINFAHEYNAAAVVAEYFYAQDAYGKTIDGYEILQRHGYRIPPLGGPRIRIYDNAHGDVYVFGQIGNEIYQVDVSKIRQNVFSEKSVPLPIRLQAAS